VVGGLPEGEALLSQGVHEMEQYFILDGILKRVVSNQEAKEMILRFSEEGQMETELCRLAPRHPRALQHRVRDARPRGQAAAARLGALPRRHPEHQAGVRVRGDAPHERDPGATPITLHLLDAPGRVKRFLRKHPELEERLPKKELASYLNLSRRR
jgi:CRP-like cAMP-binding protein